MGIEDKDFYFVALKVFLELDGKLFIFKDRYGEWDLPGGRIRKDEFRAPLEDIIKRKMAEELGSEVEYILGKSVVFMRHERREATAGNPLARIFAIGYRATFLNGEVHLSNQHTEMKWVGLRNFKPEEYFSGGWLEGVREYLRIRETAS